MMYAIFIAAVVVLALAGTVILWAGYRRQQLGDDEEQSSKTPTLIMCGFMLLALAVSLGATIFWAHMQGVGGGSNRFKVLNSNDVYDVSLTGNAVSLEQQAVLIAKNAMDYQLATTLYGKGLGMIRTAVGQRR